MGMGAKTAGVLSGLAIGLAAGVFLAALNPIVPREPPREVADAAPAPVSEPEAAEAARSASGAARLPSEAPAAPAPSGAGNAAGPKLPAGEAPLPPRPGIAPAPAEPETGVADAARRPALESVAEELALAPPAPDRPAPRAGAPAPLPHPAPAAPETGVGIDSRSAPELALPEPVARTEIGQGAAPEASPGTGAGIAVAIAEPPAASGPPSEPAAPHLSDMPDTRSPRAIARPEAAAPASGAPQVVAPELPAGGLAGEEGGAVAAPVDGPAAPLRTEVPQAPAPRLPSEDLALPDEARMADLSPPAGEAPVATPAPRPVSTPELKPAPAPLPAGDTISEALAAAPAQPVEAKPEARPAPAIEPDAGPVEAAEQPGAPEPAAPQRRPVISSRLPTVGDGATAGGPRRIALGQGASTRLPRIGAQAAPEAQAQPEAAEEPEAAAADEGGALARNSLPFAGADRPLLAVVILDDGTVLEKLDALAAIGLPFAVAISADAPDAAVRAARVREAGLEVLAMAPRDVRLSLSGNQSRGQVRESLEAIFARVPGAIGLVDRPAATLQKDRRLAAYVVEQLAETGHGLVTYSGGLNAVPRLAAARAVPVASVSRRLAPGPDSADAVAQALNRAAFEARARGAAVVMMPPDPALLQALIDWVAGARGRSLAPAPLSAAMRAGADS